MTIRIAAFVTTTHVYTVVFRASAHGGFNIHVILARMSAYHTTSIRLQNIVAKNTTI